MWSRAPQKCRSKNWRGKISWSSSNFPQRWNCSLNCFSSSWRKKRGSSCLIWCFCPKDIISSGSCWSSYWIKKGVASCCCVKCHSRITSTINRWACSSWACLRRVILILKSISIALIAINFDIEDYWILIYKLSELVMHSLFYVLIIHSISYLFAMCWII